MKRRRPCRRLGARGGGLADTTTGDYTLTVLPPGTYRVTAVGTNLNASKTLNLRNGQDPTGVNFP